MKIKFISTVLSCLLLLGIQMPLSGQTYDMDILCDESYSPFVPLSDCMDPDMEASLMTQLNKNPRWKKLINNKKMAVGLVDLSSLEDIKFTCVNCDHMMYAASLPKIAILLASMQAFEDGELKETDEISKDLYLMISKSDNRASTRMIDRVSFEKIEEVLTDSRYLLYDEDLGGGLWVGKRYAAQGRRMPDPIKGLSHAATVRQICRFYYLMARGQLVSEDRSRQMLEIMVDPSLHHKFVNTLDVVAPKAKIYRKSGSWRTYHSDSALVWGPNGRQYILTALVDDPSGEKIMRQLVKEVEKVLHPVSKRS